MRMVCLPLGKVAGEIKVYIRGKCYGGGGGGGG